MAQPREIQKILKLMNKTEFFKEFSSAEKKTIAGLKSLVATHKRGDFVIRQGETDSTIYILLEGKLAITKNDAPDAELSTLHPGAIFGEVPLITGKSRTTNVIAKGKVIVVKMDGNSFAHLDPHILNKFKDQLLKLLIGRLDNMNKALAELKASIQKFYARV